MTPAKSLRSSSVLIVLIATLALTGCGDKAPEDTTAESPPATEAPTADPATEPSSSEPSADPSTQENPREAYLRSNIVTLAEGEFPDDTGLEWLVHGFDHQGDLSFVEVEPKPATVGYPRFKLAVSFQDENAPTVIANYALIDGEFKLFGSMPGFEDTLPASLPARDDS